MYIAREPSPSPDLYSTISFLARSLNGEESLYKLNNSHMQIRIRIFTKIESILPFLQQTHLRSPIWFQTRSLHLGHAASTHPSMDGGPQCQTWDQGRVLQLSSFTFFPIPASLPVASPRRSKNKKGEPCTLLVNHRHLQTCQS